MTQQKISEKLGISRMKVIKLLQRATQIALIHNHPSGNPHPSNDDQRLTELVRKAAQTMNIHLTDHVIVTDGSHYSFNDEGLL